MKKKFLFPVRQGKTHKISPRRKNKNSFTRWQKPHRKCVVSFVCPGRFFRVFVYLFSVLGLTYHINAYIFFYFPFFFGCWEAPKWISDFLFITLGPWDRPFHIDNPTSFVVFFQQLKWCPPLQSRLEMYLSQTAVASTWIYLLPFHLRGKAQILSMWPPLHVHELHTPIEPAQGRTQNVPGNHARVSSRRSPPLWGKLPAGF